MEPETVNRITPDVLLSRLAIAVEHFVDATLRAGPGIKHIGEAVAVLPLTVETYRAIGLLAELAQLTMQEHRMQGLPGERWQAVTWAAIYVQLACTSVGWALDGRLGEDARERHAEHVSIFANKARLVVEEFGR
jgi:hypothetical protein